MAFPLLRLSDMTLEDGALGWLSPSRWVMVTAEGNKGPRLRRGHSNTAEWYRQACFYNEFWLSLYQPVWFGMSSPSIFTPISSMKKSFYILIVGTNTRFQLWELSWSYISQSAKSFFVWKSAYIYDGQRFLPISPYSFRIWIWDVTHLASFLKLFHMSGKPFLWGLWLSSYAGKGLSKLNLLFCEISLFDRHAEMTRIMQIDATIMWLCAKAVTKHIT